MVTASFVGMYYTLQADIEEAKKLGTAAAKLAPTIVQHQSVLKATPLITAPLKTDTSSFSYKIGNKRPRKSMVVKRNK